MYKLLLFFVLLLVQSQNLFFTPSVKVCQQHYDCPVGEYCNKHESKTNGYGRCAKVKGAVIQPKKKPNTKYVPPISEEALLKNIAKSLEQTKKHNPEDHSHCGNEHMHHRSPAASLHPNLQTPCGSSEFCDYPTNRDLYTSPPNKVYKIFWMVFNCTGQETWYQNAQTQIAAAHGQLNTIYSTVGYKFIAYITYYPCTGTQGNQDYSSFDSYGNNVITAVTTEIGTNYQNNGGFVIVSGVPQDPSLGGFMYLPFTGYSYSGIGFMNTVVVTSTATTLPHEMGHAFGLYHTFHGVSETINCQCAESVASDLTGDYCADTPPVARNWECASPISTSTYPDPCTARGAQWDPNPYQNLMSYGNCRISFTYDQIKRIRCYQDKNLPWLVQDTSGGNVTYPPPPNPNPTNPTNPNGASSTKISIFGALILFVLALLQ